MGHLLDVPASIDLDSNDVWIVFHNPWQIVLRPKVEKLPGNHRIKPECLGTPGMLSGVTGNCAEQVVLLTYALKLFGERENHSRVAFTLRNLSNTNCMLGRRSKGIDQAREALKIYEWLGEAGLMFRFLWSVVAKGRTAWRRGRNSSQAIKLLPKTGQEYSICQSRPLGEPYRSKGDKEKAIRQFEVALAITSVFAIGLGSPKHSL